MIDLINSSLSSMSPQAPTDSTLLPPPQPVPFTVQDCVTLSSTGDPDDGGIDAAPV